MEFKGKPIYIYLMGLIQEADESVDFLDMKDPNLEIWHYYVQFWGDPIKTNLGGQNLVAVLVDQPKFSGAAFRRRSDAMFGEPEAKRRRVDPSPSPEQQIIAAVSVMPENRKPPSRSPEPPRFGGSEEREEKAKEPSQLAPDPTEATVPGDLEAFEEHEEHMPIHDPVPRDVRASPFVQCPGPTIARAPLVTQSPTGPPARVPGQALPAGPGPGPGPPPPPPPGPSAPVIGSVAKKKDVTGRVLGAQGGIQPIHMGQGQQVQDAPSWFKAIAIAGILLAAVYLLDDDASGSMPINF
jgi:hypothetical protein